MVKKQKKQTLNTSFHRCQEGLKIWLLFDYVDGLHYKIYEISLNSSRSYTDSPDWLSNKKATINPKNNDCDGCFQYALSVALNFEKLQILAKGYQKSFI